jgi:hypothetical protein
MSDSKKLFPLKTRGQRHAKWRSPELSSNVGGLVVPTLIAATAPSAYRDDRQIGARLFERDDP